MCNNTQNQYFGKIRSSKSNKEAIENFVELLNKDLLAETKYLTSFSNLDEDIRDAKLGSVSNFSKHLSNRVKNTFDRSDVTKANENAIISELGSRSHAGVEILAKTLNIPRTTIRDTVKRLVIKGYLIEFPQPRKTRGRPFKLYALSRAFEEGKI